MHLQWNLIDGLIFLLCVSAKKDIFFFLSTVLFGCLKLKFAVLIRALKDLFFNNEDSRVSAARCDILKSFCMSRRVPQPCIFDIISISSIIHEDKLIIYRHVSTDQVRGDFTFYNSAAWLST